MGKTALLVLPEWIDGLLSYLGKVFLDSLWSNISFTIKVTIRFCSWSSLLNKVGVTEGHECDNDMRLRRPGTTMNLAEAVVTPVAPNNAP